jgi:hypothetical protein
VQVTNLLGGRSNLTLFEYLAAANTLILSFAVLRLLGGVAHAVRPERLYWVHVSWLALGIGFCLISFWGFWSYRGFEWTFPLFLGVLAPTTLVYVFSSLIVPPDPSSVASWREYFFSVRIPLLGTAAVFTGGVLLCNQLLLGVSVLHPTSLGPWVLLALCLAGLASGNARLHAALALVPPALILVTIPIFARPDAFMSFAR